MELRVAGKSGSSLGLGRNEGSLTVASLYLLIVGFGLDREQLSENEWRDPINIPPPPPPPIAMYSSFGQ